MSSYCKYNISLWNLFFLLYVTSPLDAQDLDPRAYIWGPIKGNFVNVGFSYSNGGVLTDPSIPIEDLKAKVQTPSIGYLRSFNFFGKTAQAFMALPFSWAQATGVVVGQNESTNRSGFSDLRMRFSVLLRGAPATTLENFSNRKQKTILGFSLNIISPTGQYFPDKLINLGTNRWSFRPEFALSHPLRRNLRLDVYTGLWLFTNNQNFYTGQVVRKQEPLATLQTHISYDLNPKMWVALDGTYYYGGNSTLDGVYKDDRQSNLRVGATLVIPFLKRGSIRLAASTGAIVRSGADFDTFSIGWQTGWVDKPKLKK